MAGVVGRVSGDSLGGLRTGPRPLFPRRWGALLPCLVFCATALRRAGGLVACPARRGALGRFLGA